MTIDSATTVSQTMPATRIVILDGHEFDVEANVGDEQIRDTLAPDYPHVRGAEIKKGTTLRDGVTHDTIEFVRRVGTKGLPTPSPSLIACLRRVPPHALPFQELNEARRRRQLRKRLFAGAYTIGEALALPEWRPIDHLTFGGNLGWRCLHDLIHLAPVAAPAHLDVGGWSR